MTPDNTIPEAPDNQGEGNREAARNYNQATRRFIDEGKVEPAAKDAASASSGEVADMRSAEKEGRSHSKGEDPALHRKGSPTDIERSDEHGRAGDLRSTDERGGGSGRSSDAAQHSVQRESMSDSGTGGGAQERQR